VRRLAGGEYVVFNKDGNWDFLIEGIISFWRGLAARQDKYTVSQKAMSKIFIFGEKRKMRKSSPKILLTYFRPDLLFPFYPMFRRR
jgi:hypothetical protein